jgi:aminopeptidase N
LYIAFSSKQLSVNKCLFIIITFSLSLISAQQSKQVDFTKIIADIELQPDSAKVIGQVQFSFKVLEELDSVFIDAKGLKICNNDAVKWINYDLNHRYDGKKIWIKGQFKPNKLYNYSIFYETIPKKALYFLKTNNNWNIWTQGQGKYTSNWLPSFDDVNQKFSIDLNISFDKGYTVLANGRLDHIKEEGDRLTWSYKLENPMSSYLIALAIGKYTKRVVYSNSAVPIELYFPPRDSIKAEPTYRYTKTIFDFFENEFDYSYPWEIYRQVPVHDFLYAGMENTGLTIFSDAFVVDSIGFNDRNYINVNAHEMAHQWFGDLVTAKSGEHHWLQEGFATYYALLAEKELFGEDHYYYQFYKSAQELGMQDDAGGGTSLLNPKSSSLTFYQRGAWVLHALRSRIGNAAFRRAVNTYLKTYEFASAETDDFLNIVSSQTGEDLSEFKDLWIVQKRFPFEAAIALLREQSEFVVEYMIINCEANSSKCSEYLKYGLSDEAKIKVIAQRPDLVTKSTFKNSFKVRRAIAQYLTRIPVHLKSEFESLLEDPSYLTIESALYNLWVNFPADRSRYLSKTRGVSGLSNRNVRVLWLVLHLNTPEFQPEEKENVYQELLSYTGTQFNADLRMDAFEFLKLLNACNETCQKNLGISQRSSQLAIGEICKRAIK